MLHVTMKKYASMSTSRRHFLIASGITKEKESRVIFFESFEPFVATKVSTIMKWIKGRLNVPAGQLMCVRPRRAFL